MTRPRTLHEHSAGRTARPGSGVPRLCKICGQRFLATSAKSRQVRCHACQFHRKVA